MINFLNSNHIKYFLFYYKPLKWRIPILLVFSACVAFLDGIGLALFIPLFQVAESGASGEGDLGNLDFVLRFFDSIGVEVTVGVIIIFLLSLFSLKALVNFSERYFLTNIRVGFMRKIRIQLVKGLCDVSYPGFVNIDLGRIQNVITAEITKAGIAFSSYFATLQNAITLIGYLLLAFIANFQFALLITLAGLLSNFIYKFINKRVETSSLLQSYIGNGLQSKILESVWNYKYLKATGLISLFRKRLIDLTNDSENLSRRIGILSSISMSLREPVSIAMVCAVIYIQVIVMEVSMYSIVLSLLLFYRSLTSLLSLQNSWQGFLSNSGAIHTVSALYSDFEKRIESHENEEMSDFSSEIKFENVSFSYAPHLPNVLDDVDITIKKNQTIAFVGESGSGKTTLVNMMAGLLLPVSGRIIIDGVNLTPSRAKSYRRMIGYITQEPVVFNDSVYNNITFNVPRTPENIEKFWKTLDKTALTTTVNALPEKENSLLGDNGILISGGQKQRISIARELFRDCSLLLMDEATSALDTENEIIIQSNINALKGKYTIIIIAHRLSTVRNADIIYLLDKGKIAASGDFESLQAVSPRFRKMVELQEF